MQNRSRPRILAERVSRADEVGDLQLVQPFGDRSGADAVQISIERGGIDTDLIEQPERLLDAGGAHDGEPGPFQHVHEIEHNERLVFDDQDMSGSVHQRHPRVCFADS